MYSFKRFFEEMTITQSSDVYQLSILLFELLFSATRNLLTIEQDEYEAVIENFLNEDLDERIPKNFFRGSKSHEDKTVSLNRLKQNKILFCSY